jgi:hypothetical protein
MLALFCSDPRDRRRPDGQYAGEAAAADRLGLPWAAVDHDAVGRTEWRSLSLGRNAPTTLPRGIARLEKLTHLGLRGNPLRSPPDELWRLPCLVTPNLADAGLTDLSPAAATIPSSIGPPGQRVHG